MNRNKTDLSASILKHTSVCSHIFCVIRLFTTSWCVSQLLSLFLDECMSQAFFFFFFFATLLVDGCLQAIKLTDHQLVVILVPWTEYCPVICRMLLPLVRCRREDKRLRKLSPEKK